MREYTPVAYEKQQVHTDLWLMASSLDPGKMHHHSLMGLYSGSNQHVAKSGLEEVPIHGAELFNEVMNLLNLNGMNYSKLMTRFAFLHPFTYSARRSRCTTTA